MKRKVYIASPYTIGDVGRNLHIALKTADELMTLGYIPFVPIIAHFQHILSPRPYEDWMKWGDAWLRECDILLRIQGESKGADMEEVVARAEGIPICYSIEQITSFFPL